LTASEDEAGDILERQAGSFHDEVISLVGPALSPTLSRKREREQSGIA
jgi:hypothetical protein